MIIKGWQCVTCAEALIACRRAGTPLQNDLEELHSLLSFLLPDVFSDSEDHLYATQEADQQEVLRSSYLPC